jgi:hypothetical protein
MIELPRRSVTRFFIPLIDVLTLLFCIFLLMPYVQRGDGDAGRAASDRGSGGDQADTRTAVDANPAELARRLEELRRELEKLRAAKGQVLQERLALHVLEIDPADGKLYYRDPQRVEIAGAAEASALIARQKEAAGSKEVYYLILYPRQPAGFPTQRQYANYDRWFQGTAHSFDVPGSAAPR